MVQWLRHCPSITGDTGSIPGWEIKIPNAEWSGQKMGVRCGERAQTAAGSLSGHTRTSRGWSSLCPQQSPQVFCAAQTWEGKRINTRKQQATQALRLEQSSVRDVMRRLVVLRHASERSNLPNITRALRRAHRGGQSERALILIKFLLHCSHPISPQGCDSWGSQR